MNGGGFPYHAVEVYGDLVDDVSTNSLLENDHNLLLRPTANAGMSTFPPFDSVCRMTEYSLFSASRLDGVRSCGPPYVASIMSASSRGKLLTAGSNSLLCS